MNQTNFDELRERMVSAQISFRGIKNPKILEAFKAVPRHLFVPREQRDFAYEDCPLPIGEEQTISQPYMTALMTEALEVKKGEKVLEIGTGSGYQAAILSFLGAKVYSVERRASLAEKAGEVIGSLGLEVEIKTGDGTLGWFERAPYDRIIVTAGAPDVPNPLVSQLKPGGKIVIPVGGRFHQELSVIEKISDTEIKEEKICGCMFVPLVGECGWNDCT